MHYKNRKHRSGSFSVVGYVRVVAGVTVTMADFGKYSGLYLIDSSTHTTTRGGYETTGSHVNERKSSGKTKSFIMPDIDNEVWCAADMKGEDGCIIGSKYNDQDKPPFSGNDDVGITFPGGSIHVDRASGAVTLELSGPVRIKASKIVPESATLTHNGKNVGFDHVHKDVTPGPANTGPPA